MRGRGFSVGAALLAVAGTAMVGFGLMATTGDGPRSVPAVASTSISSIAGDESTETAEFDFGDVPAPATDVVAPAAGMALPAVEVVPTRVRIPSIDVDATVVDLGLEPDRTLEVPEDISVTGWYTGRSVPGEIGPSVVVGHVDSTIAGEGVFFHLRDLVAGDTIEVERSDGSIAAFRVTEVSTVSKDEFPTDRVYGSTDQPTLRLITCGGSFDRSVRSYEHNVIVFAEFLGKQELPLAKS